MDATQVVFLGIGAVILMAAIMVVTTRNLVHAALWLIVTLFGVAVVYALLNAGFLAVVQVVIYIGAIAILFIFAVMLTRKDLLESGSQHNRAWWLGVLVAVGAFGGLLWILRGWTGIQNVGGEFPAGFDAIGALGDALVAPNAFVLPFEVASILLLAALVGAVYVAFTRR
ncbi:MAG TPA: NADH-quinone oxidoreductase subunit J [Anaerolineales bacterium]